jgi:hypothetical protein
MPVPEKATDEYCSQRLRHFMKPQSPLERYNTVSCETMSPFEVLKKFIRSSTIAENWALNIYEGLPLALRYRICCGPGFFRWLSFLKESEEWDRERFDAYLFERPFLQKTLPRCFFLSPENAESR